MMCLHRFILPKLPPAFAPIQISTLEIIAYCFFDIRKVVSSNAFGKLSLDFPCDWEALVD